MKTEDEITASESTQQQTTENVHSKPEPLEEQVLPHQSEEPELKLPPSEYEALTQELKDKPHNPPGWRRLIDLAESSSDLDKVREAFEALLLHYPNTASAQIRYIGHFLQEPTLFTEGEKLFKRFLTRSPHVDLWKFYLSYVRRSNTQPTQRDAVVKSYEFALTHIGQDKDSGDIWRDYIEFLRTGPANGTWEESQKNDALRKVFHRAVQIPIDHLDDIWHDYEAFENSLKNRIVAQKFMTELSPAYMQARTVYRQLMNHVAAVFPPPVPSPPDRPELDLPPFPTFNPAERNLVSKWKTYLKWEENNPLELEDKDRGTMVGRIQSLYRKAMVRMRFYPEIWFMAYTWTASVGKQEEALTILKSGLEANPTSYLLTFALAEVLELRKDYTEVHNVYDRFIKLHHNKLEFLEERVKAEEQSLSTAVAAPGVPPTSIEASSHSLNGSGPGSGSSSNLSSDDKKSTAATELAARRSELGQAWIYYMRFGERAEGEGGVKSFRAIFKKARNDRWAPWEVYESAAMFEYHCTQDPVVASKVFEKGLQLFPDEIEFALRYLGFLISINDDRNARALFERVITTFPSERARPLWERWARYEYQYGKLDAALQLEKRISEAYPNDPPIKRFAQRHTYLGTDAIASQDLGFAFAPRKPTLPLGRTDTIASIPGGGPGPIGGAPNAGPGAGNLLPPHKRPASPDYRTKRDERERNGDYGAPSHAHKRQRGMSPPPPPTRGGGGGGGGGDRDRDRWDPHAPPPPRSGRRFSPPPLERERAPLPPQRDREREREEDKPRQVVVPSVISWFVGELPAPSTFDGPVFRTEDLMNLLRNAVIPSTTKSSSPPPPTPPRTGGRPPPDYGPYQGPGGGRSGRRY